MVKTLVGVLVILAALVSLSAQSPSDTVDAHVAAAKAAARQDHVGLSTACARQNPSGLRNPPLQLRNRPRRGRPDHPPNPPGKRTP